MGDEDLRTVRLVGLPVAVHRQASERGEVLRRELALLEHATSEGGPEPPLRRLGRALSAAYGALATAQDEQLAEVLATDRSTVDVTYRLPVSAAEACDELEALLEELDALCREGDLLTLVTPPDQVAYRRWFLGEVREQLREGRAPRPWSEAAAEAEGAGAASGPSASTGEADPGDAKVVVRDDLDLALAPALREELISRTEAGARRVVVDVTGCTFMDSTGLSLLLTTHLRLAAEGGELRVVGAHGQVLSVLRMSGVHELLAPDGS